MFNLRSWSRKIPGRRGCFIRNFSNEPTIFLHAGFSSNKIVVCILKTYCCFLLCFLLHSLLRCFLIVKESRSGHPLQLYLHTLCYWLEDGHWLRPLANIHTSIFFWLNRPRANCYSLSHFSPSVDFLSLSLSLCTLNFLPLSSYQPRSTPSQTTQVNCRERAPICELLSQREICSDL